MQARLVRLERVRDGEDTIYSLTVKESVLTDDQRSRLGTLHSLMHEFVESVTPASSGGSTSPGGWEVVGQ
jgi:hypothetical protein